MDQGDSEKTRDDRADLPPIPSNADPTGGGPPPGGAETKVIDGHGITQGDVPGPGPREGEDARPGRPA